MTTPAPAISDSFEAAQRNTLRVLFGSAVFARAAATLSFPVAVLLIKDMLGSATWAGLSTVAITIGTAIGAQRLSSLMSRTGRRPGLVVGYVAAAAGALVALVGAQADSIFVFLLGLVLIGVGAGGGNLARYAAADLAPPERRGRAISFIVGASAIGAIGGPTLLGTADEVGRSAGLAENVGPFALTAALLAIAAAIVFALLRPDPLVLSGGLDSPTGPKRKNFFAALAVIASRPMSRLALASLVISQAVMVGVMAMTPLHMDDHGHSSGMIGWVISAHVAGMYAFAPIAGWAADRFGQVRAVVFGAAMLLIATTMTSFAGDAPPLLMFPGLYLLGLGWSFGMVGGSALLTEWVPDEDRVSAQGAADLIASIVSGSAALGSGVVLSVAGYPVLSIIGLIAAGALMVVGATRTQAEPRLAV